MADRCGRRTRRRVAVGLLGGSFNPAHEGHRHISLVALKRLRLRQVWWLVTPQNPLKPTEGMADLADRVAGARARARHPAIRVIDIEARLATRYTVDTLAALRRRYPRNRFVWLMGADNLVQLPRWRRWTTLARRAPIAILARAAYDSRALSGRAAQRLRRFRIPESAAQRLAWRKPPVWVFLHLRHHPASGTAIRRQIAAASASDPAGTADE